MEIPADDFVPVTFDGNFLLTNGKGRIALAVYGFNGNKPPTDDQVRLALKEILAHTSNEDMRPMTRAEVALLDAKKETRQ